MTSTTPVRLEPGSPAPAFRALDHTGTERTSDEFSDTKLVVFFYPRAFTPGCTTEACDFRDRHDIFAKAGYALLGVSPDLPDKLAEFRDEYDLPFDLLSDPDHEMAAAYGAWGTKKNYGREYEGIIRSTILIDADGTVEDAHYNVRAKGHAERMASGVVG